MRFAVSLSCFFACAALALPNESRACSVVPPDPLAIPRTGASNVSTATSIVVFSPAEPRGLTLTVGTSVTPLPDLDLLGSGIVSSQAPGQFWRVRGIDFLEPSALHVVSVNRDGGPVELTRFTTASGYDKAQGTPPQLRSLELWRVRYPLSEISSGNCVFAEYHGFIRFDYDPASIPNTLPESTINSITLQPKTGGSSQVFYFTGNTGYEGQSPVPDDHLFGPWRPEVDPTREYCAWLTASGDGDLARLPMQSEQLCTSVVELSNAGVNGGLVGADGASVPALDGGAEAAPTLVKGCSCRMAPKARGWPSSILIMGIALLGVGRRRSRIMSRCWRFSAPRVLR